MASYGTEAGVAALVRRFTNAGVFDTTTNPTYANVTSWLAQISTMVNLALSAHGFTVPVTDSDVTPALDGFVNAMAADLAMAANSAGRFFSDRAQENGVSPIKVINSDVNTWVDSMTPGLVALGAVRGSTSSGAIAYRDGDDNGNAVSPLFGRDSFGADPRRGR